MKIRLIVIGKTSEHYLQEGEKEYLKRIKRFVSFDYVLLASVKNAKNLPMEELKKKEGQAILGKIEAGDENWLLDEHGKTFKSSEFAGFIEKKMLTGNLPAINFIVGGAYGFSEEVYNKVTNKISLSKMTFSHQMVRLFFLEQLYRSFSIIHHLPYHNE